MDLLRSPALLDAVELATEEVALVEREAIGFPGAQRKPGGLEYGPALLRDLQVLEDFGIEIRHESVQGGRDPLPSSLSKDDEIES